MRPTHGVRALESGSHVDDLPVGARITLRSSIGSDVSADSQDVVLASYAVVDDETNNGARNLTVEWPSTAQHGAEGPARISEMLLSGLERLAIAAPFSGWHAHARLRQWRDTIDWHDAVLAPPGSPTAPRARVRSTAELSTDILEFAREFSSVRRQGVAAGERR
jgi:hypothetical protein